jgi:hypothetical protein
MPPLIERQTETLGLQMASLKTVCRLYDWKYDTIYKKWKRGEFVQGFKAPRGRSIRFNLKDVAGWARQSPVIISRPSLLADEL